MLLRLDSISWLRTLENNSLRRLVVNTLFQEMMDHHNQKDGFRETRELDPYWKLRPVVYMANMELKIEIWSLSEDTSQSWVRISHGSNKFMIDSNHNQHRSSCRSTWRTSVTTEDEGFCSQIEGKKQNHKEENLLIYRASFRRIERKWIDIEPGDSSLSAYEISKKVINLLRHSQTIHRGEDGAVQFWRIKNYLQNQFPQNHLLVWRSLESMLGSQEEEQKGDISTPLIFQEQLFISELFKDIQDVISLILHCRTM